MSQHGNGKNVPGGVSTRWWLGAMSAWMGLLTACGTVAGNPKKADAGGKPVNPPASGVVDVALPVIDFDIADETFAASSVPLAPESAVLLSETPTVADADDVASAGERAFFNAYGRRVNAIVRELNRTARRTNALLKAHGVAPADAAPPDATSALDEEVGTEVARFEKRGKAANLSAIVRKTSAGQEAVLCVAGKPYQVLRWSLAGTAVELWRDFRVAQGDGEAKYGVVSHVKATKDAQGALLLDVASLGTWLDDSDVGPLPKGLVERLFARKTSAKGMTLRAVTDRFEGAVPSRFEADAYIVAKLRAKEGDRKGFEPSFIAYSSAPQRVSCKDGFDESAADLWSPTFQGPRFCMGRRFEGGRFDSAADFRAHVEGFENIGIARRADLETVAMPKTATCP